MKFQSILNTATSALAVGTAFLAIPAFAQSTASTEFEEGAIVVSGLRETAVGGIDIPETPKAKVAITQELIARQQAGQTINQTLNLVPGVSFTNNDPWGSLGGSFTVRGFGADRVSQTIDGIPLNDSGNYAMYTNQMVDPELISAATVSLGSTDVDSPTASAAGGTINISTKTPDDDFGVMTSMSMGDVIARGNDDSRLMYRAFVKIETGEITNFGTKAWISASTTENKSTFSNYGGVNKQQYNAKIYQPIGDNGDFISVAGHYNENRNNFNGSPFGFYGDLSDYGVQEPGDRFYDLYDGTPCTTVEGTFGVQDSYNSCGTPFERRYNPSNTGNIRVQSRFTLADDLILNVEPSYQYVKANGGGTSVGYEGLSPDGLTGGFYMTDPNNPARPTRSTQYYYFGGTDLNGDGDTLDYVTILSPSQTQTRRFGVIANLTWDISDNNRVRVAYTFDRARHRQTGTAGFLKPNAEPYDVFPINDPILDADGIAPQKRNRKSIAMLNQISGEYRGSFMDDSLIVQLGARMPFFERELNQYCVTTDTDGNVNCPNGGAAIAQYLDLYPDNGAPGSKTIKYDKLLPNLGVTYKFTPEVSVFGSYAKNLSVPGTDALYGTFYSNNPPVAETSDAVDLGLRFQSGNIQAQVSGWYNGYNNRLASAYNADCDCTITRNLGKVETYGIDGNVSWRPIPEVLVYVFGSYLKSEIQDDVEIGDGEFAATAGKRQSGAPKYSFGGRIEGSLGPVDLGVQAKRTGTRYLTDTNSISLPGYTVVDLDARISLAGLNLDKSYFQLNLNNLFDEVYIGSASTGLTSPSNNYVNIGSPRSIMGSFIMQF
ncbi:TonB-dependent receptor [Novosphingobium sp. YJ-S2-02]|uniref:TonB-dependent receptor n=1 Tax=Novosphingobium aureum TaxID=2792964 RepID=A0A931MK65_9SPHN|nr:TonB-dependent receptor [Novosphingobium aureum]MBH0112478.1 TonB-dependent receptor [Novosphingobium aureum]